MRHVALWLGIVLLGVVGSAVAQRTWDTDILAETFGFDEATPKTVALADLRQGCPRRDCIESIDNPKYVAASDASHVADDDLVITLSYKGEQRAYPSKILDHHEIVNDTIAGDPLAITWCPLCGSATGIRRSIDGEVTSFGVSGVLYNSDLVLYDRASETLWDQIRGSGIVGARTGETLAFVPVSVSKFARWKARHPETLVLSDDTGFEEDYTQDRFADYRASSRLYMPVSNSDDRIHAKTIVFGFDLPSGPLAITASRLEADGRVRHGASEIVLLDDGSVVLQSEDREFHPIRLFWFAWYTFHPRTNLIE